MDRIHQAILALVRITEGVAAALIGVIVVANAAQIFCRYVLVQPLSFTDELMRFSMVWVAFLAGSALVFRREHMAANIFDNPRLGWLRRAMAMVVLLAILGFAVALAWFGWPLALRNARQLSPSWQVPMIWPYIAVPIGGALMALYASWLLIVSATGRMDEMALPVDDETSSDEDQMDIERAA